MRSDSIYVALLALIALELFHVFVCLLFGLAALLLNDFAQRSIDVLSHPARVAAYKEVRAFGIEPFPISAALFNILFCTYALSA